MKNKTKMGLCIAGLVGVGIIAQIKLGNEPALIMGALLLFSVGFGWYAKCTKIDDDLSEDKENNSHQTKPSTAVCPMRESSVSCTDNKDKTGDNTFSEEVAQ